MANNIQAYAQMADSTAAQLTASLQEWTAFLTTAARLYKYPYPEQLMIYAQRPDATACASYELWNKRMGRYVRRGSTGIALIDMTGDSPKIKYVFDVADTGRTDRSRNVNLWEYRPEHADAVSTMLERRYDVTGENGIEEQFEKVAAQLADEYWNAHQQDILSIVDDSFLYGYDDFNVGVAFRNAATVSITYSLMSRCGLNPEDYFEHEDFLSIFDWNTSAAVAELGTAVSTINQEVLRQIEITIKQYEREHSAERTEQHEKQPDLSTQRGLPDSQPRTEPAAVAEPRQVREDAEEVSSGEQAGALQPPVTVGEAASAPAGDRPGGAQPLRADDAGAGDGGRSDRGAESQRPDEVDGADEHLQGAGGGSDSERADIQLTTPVEGEQISLFPTENEQIQFIAEAEGVPETPFAFSISDEDFAHVLRLGGNTDEARMKVATEFSKRKSTEELAAFLQKTYHGGNGFTLDSGRVSVWYAEDGIHLAKGDAARTVRSAQVIPWEDAVTYLDTMLDGGSFATNVELAEAPGYERRQIAETLLYLHHDLTEEAHEAGILSVLDELRGGGYPDEIERVAAFLEQPENRASLLASYGAFMTAYQEDRDVLRFHYHRPAELQTRLQELDLPRMEYTSDMAEVPTVGQFITEDEISQTLAGGSGVSGGKIRIYSFFREQHTLKEQTDFLKKEYGTGGRSHAVSGASYSGEDHSSKGIKLQKRDCFDVQMAWNNVAKRITALIREDRYLNAEEKAQMAASERKPEQPAAESKAPSFMDDYNAVKEAHPDDLVLYQVGDFFEMFGEDARNAAEELSLTLTSRSIGGDMRVDMCGIPIHVLEKYTEQLRGKYDVTVSAIDKDSGGHKVYSLPSVDHEAEKAIDEGEAEFGADGIRAFRNMEAEQPQPTIRELFERYKPTVINAVSEDTAYRNACGHSDRENAMIEGNAAVRRAILNSGDMELIRLFSDVPEFRRRLHQEVFEETYPRLHELLRPLSQDDIDDALRAWNGDIESKHAVIRYMEKHARDKDTAAWLSREYGGGDESKSLFIVRAGSPESTELTWAKVQRRIAQLIQKDDFYTDAERDNYDDIDPVAIREHLESGESSRFVEQVMADVERIAAQEAAEIQEEQPAPAAEVPEAEAAPADEERRDPLAPAYKVGDTVYLDDTVFQITDIRGREIELRDPALYYPVFRAESKTQFERLLRRDERNSHVTDYLPAALDLTDIDLQEVLTVEDGFFNQQDKNAISAWLRSGESNSIIAEKLSMQYSGRSDSTELSDVRADHYSSLSGLEIVLVDNTENRKGKVSATWGEIAEIVRAMYEQERYGFTHEPVSPVPVAEEKPIEDTPHEPSVRAETVAVYPAEPNNLPFDVVIETLHFDEPEQEQPQPENFRITDDNLGVGGAKAKFRMNMDAINLLKELEFDSRQATPEEQEVLSRYVGWGGLADAFDESKPNWSDEFRELYATLTPEEYAAARASTLNAHYTSPTVIKAIYEAIGNMGFQSGNILEPSMGVGNFFGLLPDNMAGSRLYGVELDSITGRIAKQLYPNADITVAGFETTDRKDFFDLAVGNVPFGNYKVNDRAYNKLNFNIHNYFFAKALDQVRPGGVVAFVTSRYTMDAKDPTVRKYLAERADLLGAIRLPTDTFKANAGTEVTTDIIFLQKRDRPIEIEPDWVHLGLTPDNIPVNSYFVEHPEMVMGTLVLDDKMYGDKNEVVCEPFPGAVLSDQLHEAVQNIRGTYEAVELPDLGEEEAISNSIPADPDVKNYSYAIVDGEMYYRENSIMVKPDLNATAIERVKGLVELRDCVQKLIGQQMDGFISDATIQATQAELNRLYDSFTAKYGLINSRANSLAFADDSSYFLLCSLEELDEDRNLKRKADMFTKRTIKPHEVVTSVDTAVEALALSIGERGKVDMEYMCQLTGLSEQQMFDDLKGVIFLNPLHSDLMREPKYLTADEYLSGDVREKLRIAETSAALYEGDYSANVEALRQVQPKDLDASEIDVRLGATWLDPAYIQQFMEETFNTPFYVRQSIQVNYAAYTGEWNITGKRAVGYNNIEAYMTYGTERANAYKILEDTLNLRDVRIYDTKVDADGKERRVLNSKETTLAQQKQQAIKDAFQDWIWRDPDRRQAIVQKYNELFNSTRPREYDGQHIIFSGMNPEIRLREHQLNAVAHILYGGNTLLAHEVGAGKSATRS